MKVTMTSMLTGNESTREIDVTQEQLDHWKSPKGKVIQIEFAHLSSDDREFLITGSTPFEWDALVQDDEFIEREQFEESIDREGAANDDTF